VLPAWESDRLCPLARLTRQLGWSGVTVTDHRSPWLIARQLHGCILQGMARVRSGQAPAWPLVSDRSVRRGSGVKRDFACTSTSHFSPCACCPAVTVTLEAGGAGTDNQRAIPGSEPHHGSRTFGPPGKHMIRSHPYGRPDPFRSVRDLGRVPARCSWPSGIPEGRSPRWLPVRLPAAHDTGHRDALVLVTDIGPSTGEGTAPCPCPDPAVCQPEKRKVGGSTPPLTTTSQHSH
jgi:hypothetical protein